MIKKQKILDREVRDEAGVPLYIEKIKIINFRNIKHQVLQFTPGVFVVQGANGQGKSNFLESIYLLCLGKSYRSNRDSDLVCWQKPYYYLQGDVSLEGQIYRLEVGYEAAKKRKVIKVNGKQRRQLYAELSFPVVFFVPEDLEIVRRGPEERRRYIDMEIGSGAPLYTAQLQRYKKALFQKNRLLKEVRSIKTLEHLLPPWNEQLAYFGSRIIHQRAALINSWNRLAAENYRHLFEEEMKLWIAYRSLEGFDFFDKPLPVIEKTLQEELASLLSKEQEVGYSLSGPHRDEIVFFLNNRDARRFASHGQQRGIVIALKAAQVQIYAEAQRKALFLMDDIFSELDEVRRERCFTLFDQAGQVFLTLTRKEKYVDNFIKRFQNRFFLSVEGGQISQI